VAFLPQGEEKLAHIRSWAVSIAAVMCMLLTAMALPIASGEDTLAEWTVMVYLDGDNNLDPDSVDDIMEMEMVGSTEKVNVIVLWDRYNEPAYVYKVVEGDLELLDGMTVGGMPVNGEEISMADWRVLEAFVDFSKATMPANHYMLDLWDHGSAFGYTCWDDHWMPPWYPRSFAISLSQVVDALEGTGNMDILTYDGCTIGMAEIAHNLTLVPEEMNADIGYLVASEEYIPNSGYAYNNILTHMNEMSDLSADAVAKMLCDDYAECYSPKGQAKGSSTVGLSAIDLSKIEALAPLIKSLTEKLVQGLSKDFSHYHRMISDARGDANLGWSLNGWDKRVDLGTFLKGIAEMSEDEEIKGLAADALGVIKDSVYVANTPALESQSATGLGVWFPTSYRSLGNANNGGFYTLGLYSLVFGWSEDAGWMSFLHAYWGK
jgi:hypothetical protein